MWTPHGASLSIPVVAAPLFIISNPDLVIAQCKAGVVGSFPALNARPSGVLEQWIAKIEGALAPHPDAAPYAVNLIVHRSNARLEEDLEVCVRHHVPIVITSLGARADVNEAIHSYGGIVLHDVTNLAHARKAVERGADGLIAVATGAGGHAGTLSPFALVQEIRKWWDGPLLLSGSIATGQAVMAAQIMGADCAYVGSRFIASSEANAPEAYKQMIVDSAADDIVYTGYVTGIPGNYLKQSFRQSGLDPENLSDHRDQGGVGAEAPKAWKDIWGSGQGIGLIDAVEPAAVIIGRMREEYRQACERAGHLRSIRCLPWSRRKDAGIS